MPRLFDWEYDGDSKLIAVTVDDDGDGLYEFEAVRHGSWEWLFDGYYCSNCDHRVRNMRRKPKYCEHCGAKMGAKEEDE